MELRSPPLRDHHIRVLPLPGPVQQSGGAAHQGGEHSLSSLGHPTTTVSLCYYIDTTLSGISTPGHHDIKLRVTRGSRIVIYTKYSTEIKKNRQTSIYHAMLCSTQTTLALLL